MIRMFNKKESRGIFFRLSTHFKATRILLIRGIRMGLNRSEQRQPLRHFISSEISKMLSLEEEEKSVLKELYLLQKTHLYPIGHLCNQSQRLCHEKEVALEKISKAKNDQLQVIRDAYIQLLPQEITKEITTTVITGDNSANQQTSEIKIPPFSARTVALISRMPLLRLSAILKSFCCATSAYAFIEMLWKVRGIFLPLLDNFFPQS